MRNELTYLGKVIRVTGSRVLSEISQEIPSSCPIINGRMYKIGQIGSFIRIPLGFLNLYGIVTMVGSSPIKNPENQEEYFPPGQRWIETELVGESYGVGEFKRGVSVYPTIEDEIHLVIEEDLNKIYNLVGDEFITIGSHSSSENLLVPINLDKLITRHGLIIGSTGSGKSNAVAHLLKQISSGKYPNSKIVLFDVHGEYKSALGEISKVFAIGDDTNQLIIPYWALSFDELAWFLVDRKTSMDSGQDLKLRNKIFEKKRNNIKNLKCGEVNKGTITADSPISFDIRKVWYDFDREVRATYTDTGRTNEALIEEGDYTNLEPAKFEPHSLGSAAPFLPKPPSNMNTYVNKILSKITDNRFKFFLEPGEYDGKTLDLDDLLKEWFDHDKTITIFDLAGIPYEVIDLVVGVISRIIFESMFWGRDIIGYGRQKPILIIYEEAHGYLSNRESGKFIKGYATNSVRKIMKEGRKYGMGALLVSQRPSELDDTIISQCGTFFALRLTNSSDQGKINSAMPDSFSGLTKLLSTLRTGETIIVGEAIEIPSRVKIPLVEPRPLSGDPEITKCWKLEKCEDTNYKITINNWRNQNIEEGEEK